VWTKNLIKSLATYLSRKGVFSRHAARQGAAARAACVQSISEKNVGLRPTTQVVDAKIAVGNKRTRGTRIYPRKLKNSWRDLGPVSAH